MTQCSECAKLRRFIELHDGRGQAALDARLVWHRALREHQEEKHENQAR